jgi:muconolactone delta-isomerase
MTFFLEAHDAIPPEYPNPTAWGVDSRAASGPDPSGTEAAVDLMHRKVLRRTFRVVGQLANFSIWETATPEELYAALQSLPMYPFMTITVTPIIKHPVEQAYEDKHGSIPPL